MSARILFIVGFAWLGAVMLWSRFGPESFFIGIGHGKVAKLASVILAVLFGTLNQIFYIGWIVPLALGTYRLVRKH